MVQLEGVEVRQVAESWGIHFAWAVQPLAPAILEFVKDNSDQQRK